MKLYSVSAAVTVVSVSFTKPKPTNNTTTNYKSKPITKAPNKTNKKKFVSEDKCEEIHKKQ